MLIAYHSKTGNVKKFVEKLGLKSIEITESLILKEPFILITYTIGFGEIPKIVEKFLNGNKEYIKAVACSGNRNWGKKYCKAGDLISNQYSVPMILKFELTGNQEDIEKFKQGVLTIEHS